jgi:hypothetical protein
MWEILWFVGCGAALAVGALRVVTKDRRPESDEAFVHRMASHLGETMRLKAANPVGQIAYCRKLLRERVEDGADRVRFARLLAEALHRNWPHLPREYLLTAVG